MSKFSLGADFPQADQAAWRALAEKALKGADFDKTLKSNTYDELTLRPLYTLDDESDVNPSGMPGAAPFTRGFSSVTNEVPWHIRQLHGATDPSTANASILRDLEGGVTAISLKVAAPGQNGTRITSTDDLDEALKGVALDLAGVWLEAGHATSSTAAMLQELWGRRGHEAENLTGGFGADPLGTLAITGGHPHSLDQALEEATALAVTSHDAFPNVSALRVDARPYHGGGASEAEELACLCATLVAYLRALENVGLSPQAALPQIELALACDQDFFANITKLRAARALVSRIADASGALDAVPGLCLHAMTSMRMFTRYDPYVNILRTTIACAAAAIGGANSITVLPFNMANGQADNLARRIARNIQIVLQEESSLGAVIDPAGGSWYAESHTNALAEKAWGLFQEIEGEGGMAEALAKGFIQGRLSETAAQRARDVSNSGLELTGVSSFANLDDELPQLEPHAPEEPFDDPAITVEPIPLRRPAEPFESLRDQANAEAVATGNRPQVSMVCMGPERKHAEAVNYARRFFAAGGIETVVTQDKDRDGTKVACLCSDIETLTSEGGDIATSLKSNGVAAVYAVGRPGDNRKALKSSGVDGFVHPGCDMLEALNEIHDALGLIKR